MNKRIQKVSKKIKQKGTDGRCTGDKFGGKDCPPGSKQYNLAKTFRAMASKNSGNKFNSKFHNKFGGKKKFNSKPYKKFSKKYNSNKKKSWKDNSYSFKKKR